MAYIDFTETKFEKLSTLSERLQYFVNSTKHVSKWSNPTTILYAVHWLKLILEKNLGSNEIFKKHIEGELTFNMFWSSNYKIYQVLEYFSKFVYCTEDITKEQPDNKKTNSQELLRDRVKKLEYKTKQCLGDLNKVINSYSTLFAYVMGKEDWNWQVSILSDFKKTYELITEPELQNNLVITNKETLEKIGNYIKKTYDKNNKKEDDEGIDLRNVPDIRDICEPRKVTKKNWFIQWVDKTFGRSKSRKDNWIMKGRLTL